MCIYKIYLFETIISKMTFIISLLIINILSVIFHGFIYPIEYRKIRFDVIAISLLQQQNDMKNNKYN